MMGSMVSKYFFGEKLRATGFYFARNCLLCNKVHFVDNEYLLLKFQGIEKKFATPIFVIDLPFRDVGKNHEIQELIFIPNPTLFLSFHPKGTSFFSALLI